MRQEETATGGWEERNGLDVGFSVRVREREFCVIKINDETKTTDDGWGNHKMYFCVVSTPPGPQTNHHRRVLFLQTPQNE